MVDLNFRDQSQHVINKAQQTYHGQKSKSGIQSTHVQSLQSTSCLTSNIATDQPICIFLHSYVPSDSIPVKTQLTMSQIVSQAKSSRAVRCAISSIGLAMLANTRNEPRLMTEARKEYTTTLRLTNAALRHESDFLKDTTLSAVLLLGMFEVRPGFYDFLSLPPSLSRARFLLSSPSLLSDISHPTYLTRL
jgi:hypothetical protein